MNKGVAVVLCMLFAVLTAGLAYSLHMNQELRSDLEGLAQKVDKHDTPVLDEQGRLESSIVAQAAPIKELDRRVGALEQKTVKSDEKITAFSEWKETITPEVSAITEWRKKAADVGVAAGAVTKDEISKMVEKKVAEEQNNYFKVKKPNFDRFVAVLKLNEDQAESVRDAVFKGQAAVLELLKIQREDGTSFADELVDALATGDEKNVGKVFMRIVVARIPGREETYLQTIMKHSMEVREEFNKIMTPEQFSKYAESGVEPMDVEIKGNPLELYLMGQVKERKEEEGEY